MQHEADTVLNHWKDLFADCGLCLHKSKLAQKIQSIGIELDGLPLCRFSSSKFWTLRRALDEVPATQKNDRTLPQKSSMVISLSCSSVPERTHAVNFGLWDETRAELVARGLPIFAQSHWTRAWNTRVFSTDSSLSGWTMTHADWPELVVGRTGRVSERRRFISGGPGARESALAASRVVLDDDQWIVEGADDEDEETGFHVDPFSSVWLDRCR